MDVCTFGVTSQGEIEICYISTPRGRKIISEFTRKLFYHEINAVGRTLEEDCKFPFDVYCSTHMHKKSNARSGNNDEMSENH